MTSDFAEIPQETLDSLILSPEAKAHFSQENELKRLIIERETYKKAYETQQKSIDEFTTQWDKLMSTPVATHKWSITDINGRKVSYKVTQTLRDWTLQQYYNDIFIKSVRFNDKIQNEIKIETFNYIGLLYKINI